MDFLWPMMRAGYAQTEGLSNAFAALGGKYLPVLVQKIIKKSKVPFFSNAFAALGGKYLPAVQSTRAKNHQKI